MKTLIAVFATLLLSSLSVLAAGNETPRKAGELTFFLPGKGPQQLSAFQGKVVALEFIFTTCPHCQAASKLMTKLQQEYGERGLQVLDVAVNQNADLLVENFVKDHQVGFPVGWVSPDKMTAFMGFSDGRFVVPQLALIDRKGLIRYQTPATQSEDWDKLMTEEAIRQHIEELLGPSHASASRKQVSHRSVAKPEPMAQNATK